jgi:tRNA/rRNA methyltransferase
MLTNCRIVLVRPEVPANLGATARVMCNMGLTDLVLVSPVADPSDRNARQLSTHGEDILDRCRIVHDLGDALADCVFVAGTSARLGGLFRRQSLGTPQEILPRLVDFLATGPAALVFGPEPSGLTNAEVSRCHFLIHIPTDPAYPALNLAQAVAICLYELRQAWLRRTEPKVSREVAAPFGQQERMYESLRMALEEVHFLYGDKADALMHAIRHLIGRAGPTPMEVEMLFGLARQLRWFAARHGPTRHLTRPDPPPPLDSPFP